MSNSDELDGGSKMQVKESKWLVKCFLNHLRHDKNEVNVLFDIPSIFLYHTRIDYTFLKEFYIIEVIMLKTFFFCLFAWVFFLGGGYAHTLLLLFPYRLLSINFFIVKKMWSVAFMLLEFSVFLSGQTSLLFRNLCIFIHFSFGPGGGRLSS